MYRLDTKELKNGLLAFVCTWGLQLLFGMTVRNPLTLVIFAAFFLTAGMGRGISGRWIKIITLLASALISAVITALFGNRAVSGFDSLLFKLIGMVIIFAGVWLSFFIIGKALVSIFIVEKSTVIDDTAKEKVKRSADKKSLRNRSASMKLLSKINEIPDILVLLIFATICFLCWLPYFLYEYPGIMTADSIVQYEQVIGANGLSNHHPVIHTLTIAFFYNIGMSITGDVNKAISFYTLAQMAFLALCCARIVLEVKRVLENSLWYLAALIFFALVPFNAVFAVTIWKDIPFAGIAMLMGAGLCEMARKEKCSIADYVMLMVLAVLLSLFRSNGWYAYLICIPFIIWTFKKDWIMATITLLLAAGAVIVIKGPVMSAAGITQPDFTESLSLPLQQVACVLVNDCKITENDRELIERVIDTTYIHELYAPDFADNIKELVRAGNPQVIENNKMEYLLLWMRLGLKYPGRYIKAWFDLEGGYVYPDVPYEVGNIDGIMGNAYGLVSTPLIGGKAIVKGKEILIKLGSFVPLYGMLWCAGAYTWLVVFTLIVYIKKGKGRREMPFIVMQAALIGTLLIAAPVVDFRYEYGVIMLMPLCASICVMIMRNRDF